MIPVDQKATLLTKCLAAQGTFILVIIAAPLAPLTLINVMLQTSPFWISLGACCFICETISPVDIMGIIVCFCAVVMIGFQQEIKEDRKATV